MLLHNIIFMVDNSACGIDCMSKIWLIFYLGEDNKLSDILSETRNLWLKLQIFNSRFVSHPLRARPRRLLLLVYLAVTVHWLVISWTGLIDAPG